MRGSTLFLLIGFSALGGCDQSPAASSPGPKSPGRFAGIGVFEAGRLWAQISGAPSSSDPAVARLEDDEHIIVVIDSHTGEVRQCGNQSGFCVAMNPWAGGDKRMMLPAKLTKHASDLAAEDQAAMQEGDAAANAAAPTVAAE
jgi:hypothetical protein